MMILRNAVKQAVTLNTSIASCTPVDMREFAGGQTLHPAGSSVTSLTFYCCDTIDGTYLPLYSNALSPVQTVQTVAASQAVDMPPEVFGAHFIKMVPNANGTCTVIKKG